MRGITSLFARSESRQWNDTLNLPWFAPAVGGGTVSPAVAMSLSAVWACQTLIADAIATLPVDVYRKQGGTRLEVDAPGWVEQPNLESNRVEYDQGRLLSLLGWGNAYSLLVRARGTADPRDPVVERWLIDPRLVRVSRDSMGSPLRYWVNQVEVPGTNVQHIRGYVPPGGVTGMSVVATMGRTLGLALGAEEAGQKFYEQGMMMSGVLSVPQMPAETSSEIVDRLRDQMAGRYAGTGNAGKPLVLLGGTEWKQITVSPTDAQYLQTREFQVEEICRWFRVPLHKVQRITNNASQGGGNGLEQMAIEFVTDGLIPWTVKLETADSALLPDRQYVKYNTNAYVRSDIKTRHEVYSIRRNIGMANADELRALEDEPPIGGTAGTTYWQPLNMTDAAAPYMPGTGQNQGVPNGSQ